MPGGGAYLQVAPGRGWMRLSGSSQVSQGDCRWAATWVASTWSELRPWVAAERRRMEADSGTRHLAERWDALSSEQRAVVRQWHRPGVAADETACAAADAAGAGASSSCGWLFRAGAAYEWRALACLEPSTQGDGGTPARAGRPPADDPCWVTLASGRDWIRSLNDYADGRVTLSAGGDRS